MGATEPAASSPGTFACSQCGQCCQRVNLALETQFLDRGDGCCRHYDGASRQCTIYNTRPDICRVDRQYQVHYAKVYSWDEYVALNQQACALLQAQAAIPARPVTTAPPPPPCR